MKTIFSIVLSLMFFCSTVAIAADVQPEQNIKNDQSYATLNLQKQPQSGKQKQGITNHFTFFTINVQINGKINDIDPSNK
jgi:hypothetical protein